MIIYSIEGAIGVGKTTFIRAIQQYVSNNDGLRGKVLVVEEPVDEWSRTPIAGGEVMSPLMAFYESSEINAAMFQAYVLISRIGDLQRKIHKFEEEFGEEPRVIIVERYGGISDADVFCHILCARGDINIHQAEMYTRIYDEMMPFIIKGDDLRILYITAPFNDTRMRINDRDREAERIADTGHILRIFNRYEAMFADADTYLLGNVVVPVETYVNTYEHEMINVIRRLFTSHAVCLHLD